MSENPHTSLEAATIKCAQLFALRLGNSISIGTEEQKHLGESTSLFPRQNDQLELVNQQARFRIWAGSLGVLAGGSASADWRLKNDPDIKDVMMSLLRRLSESLDKLYQDEALSDSESFSDGSGSESQFVPVSPLDLSDDETSCAEEPEDTASSPVDGKFADISEIITDLYRFTAFVRKSPSTNDDERASRWAELAGDQIQNELKELEEHAAWQLRERYEKLSEKFPTLRDRILNAIVQRRTRLLYRINHQKKLERNWVSPAELQSTSGAPSAQGHRYEETAAVIPGCDLEVRNTRNQNVVSFIGTARTNATSVDRSGSENWAKSTVLSSISPSLKFNLEYIDVPPAPKPEAVGIPEAMCPFCSQPLGMDIVGNGNTVQWKQHLLQDIEPYVCLFEKCTTPGKQFKSKNAWIHHMSWEHARVWTCPHVEHGDRSFESSEGLGNHLSQEHYVEPENLASLLEKSAKPASDILATFAMRFGTRDSPEKLNACPFCRDESASFDVLEEENLATFNPVSSKEIVSHISGHLETLALLSLPPRNENNEEDLRLRDRSENNISMSRPSRSAPFTLEYQELARPIFIDPGAESDETTTQSDDRSSRSFLSSVTSYSSSHSPRRTAIFPATTALFQGFAGDGYKIEIIKGKRDILKGIGHVKKPCFHDISFGGDSLLPARIELSHSRKNSVIKITDLRTGEEEIGAAVLPRSLAGHLPNSSMQCFAPNLLQPKIYVDGKELEPCGLVRTTCAFPECPCFAPRMTYRWYWIIVNDEENVLEGRAFVPCDAGPREEIALLPTRTSIVPYPV